MKKQLFIHVGYHKTGTTWLQNEFFGKHPDISYLGKTFRHPIYNFAQIFLTLKKQERNFNNF